MRSFGASAGSATDRRLLRKAVWLGTLLVFAFSMLGVPDASPVAAGSFSDQIAAAKARQASLRRDIEQQNKLLAGLQSDAADARAALTRTSAKLDGINANLDDVRKEIRRATKALKKVQARRASLQDELSVLDQTLSQLEQEIAQGAAELDARRAALGARLADAYRTQGTSLLEQVLDSGSFTDVVTDSSAYLAYGDQDAQMAQQIQQDQASLDSLRAVTAATRYRTDQLRRAAQDAASELHAQRQVLAAAKAKYAKLKARTLALQKQQLAKAHRIARNQRQARAYIHKHQQAERKLKQKVAGLVRAAERKAARQSRGSGGGGVGAGGNGYFAWPTSGIVTQWYGCTGFYLEPPRGSCAHFHSGIDVANSVGTPIRAMGDGVVAFVGWNKYDGSDPAYVVIIGHANGLSTFYSHLLPRSVVHAGQRVSRGQLVGYMGQTGNATGPHLHFEVDRNYTPIDPRRYL